MAALVVTAASCSVAQVRVTVANRGTLPLEDVRVTVSTVTDELGTLAPKQEKSCWVRPRGETGVTITYLAPGGLKVDSGSIGYLEAGYSGSITFVVDEGGGQDANWRVNALF